MNNPYIINIISGIVTAILIYLFSSPFMKAFGNYLIGKFFRISDYIANSIIKEAAKLDFMKPSNVILDYLSIGLVFFAITYFIHIDNKINAGIKLQTELLSQSKQIVSIKEKSTNINEIELSLNDYKELKGYYNKFIIPALLVLFLLYMRTSKIRFVSKLCIGYKQKLAIIKPFIENKEYDKIQSRWAQMNSLENYDAIMNDINELIIAQKANKIIEELKFNS